MKFTPLALEGAWLIEPDPREDERGFFARMWCREEFRRRGLDEGVAQCNLSFNRARGTLRGLHFQAEPYAETKLVRCTSGAVYDVIADLRRDSETFGRWCAVELSAENRRMLYVPRGFAHGYQTLTDNAEVFYQVSAPYRPDAGRGVRWNDPRLGIAWPIPGPILSERDRTWPNFQP